jgi:hypothetical protein
LGSVAGLKLSHVLKRVSGCLILAAFFAGIGEARAGSPRVTLVMPGGAQRGAESEIECRGNNLEDARGALFDEPGFEVTPVAAEKGRFRMKIKVPPGARLGEHRFRVVTASGVSDVRLFFVGPFPVVPEVESPKAEPQRVALGTTLSGRTQGEDQDVFEVELRKGQRLSAEVIGARLHTQQIYDPFLSISKADGTRLIEVDDTHFSRQDPVASVVAPEDGKYHVSVRESTNAGTGECQYLLHLGSFPRPLTLYPLGGQTGQELKVTLLGDAKGPVEKTLRLPTEPDPQFALYPEDDQPASQPNVLRVSNFPNVLESEPNQDLATATAVPGPLPVALNGVLGENGDVDFFRVRAKKGEVYDVRVYARRMRTGVDSVLTILDSTGKQIVSNDDDGQLDSGLRWTVGADGEFLIRVADKLRWGGPLAVYRVELTPVQPRVTVALPEMVQNSNQERRAIVVPKGNRYASLVRLKRSDAPGAVELEPQELPAGVTVTGTTVAQSVDTVPMVFETGADTALTANEFKMGVRLVELPKDKTLESRIENDIDVVENGNQRAFYTLRESSFALAVTEEIPVRIELVPPQVPLLQGGAMNLKVRAVRQGDFKGPVSLSLLYSPPGIGTAGPMQIPEGKDEAALPLSANPDAPIARWKVCVVGNADFGKGPVWFSTPLVEIEVSEPFLAGKIARSSVDQGDTVSVKVRLEQKRPFEGKAQIALLGLPPNTSAEPVEITPESQEATLTIKTQANAPVALHKQLFCQFQLQKDGETMTSSFANGGVLRIDKAAVAKAQPPTPTP